MRLPAALPLRIFIAPVPAQMLFPGQPRRHADGFCLLGRGDFQGEIRGSGRPAQLVHAGCERIQCLIVFFPEPLAFIAQHKDNIKINARRCNSFVRIPSRSVPQRLDRGAELCRPPGNRGLSLSDSRFSARLGRLLPHAPNVTPLGGSCLFAGSRIAPCGLLSAFGCDDRDRSVCRCGRPRRLHVDVAAIYAELPDQCLDRPAVCSAM